MRSLFLTLLAVVPLLSVRAAEPEAFEKQVRPLLEKLCLDCHEGKNGKGDVDLARFDHLATIWQDPKLWEKVLVQLQDRVMPPAKRKTQPSDEERVQLIAWIQGTLAAPDPAQLPHDPGPTLVRRLSRLEYNRTVHDLLGTDATPADTFPPDAGGGGGFDNNASTLFLPPLFLEKAMLAAETVLSTGQPERLFRVAPGAERTEAQAARENLALLARSAFRRPAAPEVLERLAKIYETARSRGESYEAGVKLAAKAVLMAPRFLFRLEQDAPEAATPGEPRRVDDFDLASRLSYFLWSSLPDAELLQLAEQGRLHEPATLEGQTRRMLADPKARTLAENFATQWLRTKELRTSVAPAPDRYQEFTPELREAFFQEPVIFVHALLRDNQPLTDCLDCNYTYANEALAKFYGVPAVSGGEMRRVELTDRRRGGVLGMGGVLALTSYPRRTSPVLRGKWVMEEILGTPPPPPPPNVNTQELGKPNTGLTFRQQLEHHREDAKCAGCHARMDPLGFGLENYGVIGEWRTESKKEVVDASGQLVSGEKFVGPVELKTLLLEKKAEFTRNVAEKMLSYALGRGLEPADWWPVQQIARAVAADGYRTQTLILEVVRSYPFQYRRAPKPAEVAQAP